FDLPGLNVTLEPVDTATAKFDLSLDLAEQRAPDGTPTGIHGQIEYATDLFDRASVAALAGRLVRLLEAGAGEPDQALWRRDIVTPADGHPVRHAWNGAAHPVPSATVPQLFEAQAARSPDAAAVVFEDERLTYGELNARANQLAHHLRSCGVGPETVVG